MTRYTQLLLVLLLISVLSACETSNNEPTYHDSPEKQKMLEQQRALYESNLAHWKSTGLMNYEFTRSIDCDCEDKRDMVVSVVDGKIARAYYSNGQGNVNEGVSSNKLNAYVSINDFFKMIDDSIKRHYDVIDTEYNNDYGFPASIHLLQNKDNKQAAIGFRVSKFNIRYTISFPPIQKKP